MNIIIISIIITNITSSWGRERYVQEMELSHGMRSFGSMRGVSGHVHNPFAGTVYEQLADDVCLKNHNGHYVIVIMCDFLSTIMICDLLHPNLHYDDDM